MLADALRVLEHLIAVAILGSVFGLRGDVVAGEVDRGELVRADDPVLQLLDPRRGVEVPARIALDDRDREGPRLRAEHERDPIGRILAQQQGFPRGLGQLLALDLGA